MDSAEAEMVAETVEARMENKMFAPLVYFLHLAPK
jgi:hypothetical protein